MVKFVDTMLHFLCLSLHLIPIKSLIHVCVITHGSLHLIINREYEFFSYDKEYCQLSYVALQCVSKPFIRPSYNFSEHLWKQKLLNKCARVQSVTSHKINNKIPALNISKLICAYIQGLNLICSRVVCCLFSNLNKFKNKVILTLVSQSLC